MIIASIGSADSLEKTDTVGPESVVVIRAEKIKRSITEKLMSPKKLNLNSSASNSPASNAHSIPTCQQRAHGGAEDGVDEDSS